MSDDPRIAALFDRWREAVRRGAPPPVEELCRDCPELEPLLRQRLAAIATGPATKTAPPGEAGATPAEAPKQLGGFRLVRTLGEGGMGIVYEGEDVALGRRVAVKTVRPDLADELLRQRFLREARLAASVRHDNVVTIFQVGEEGSTPFLVMEFLEGETLDERLKRSAWLPVPEAVGIARQVAEGLAAAHEQGLIHRDVKPGNVWLERGSDRVKLLDFGLAVPAANEARLTSKDAIIGTPGFMAPEQIFGGPLDARTDLYALGCLLYRMLWGVTPHERPDTMKMLEAVAKEDAPNLDKVAQRLPPPLAALLRELLARNPDDRPGSANDVARRLHALESGARGAKTSTGSMPASKPASWVERLGPRQRVALAAIFLASFVALAAAYFRFTGKRDAGGGEPAGPIRVGVLHSLSGTFADTERPMVEAIVMAIDEVNEAGGVLGRRLEAVIADGHSDEHEFARRAEELIAGEKVAVIFGCSSSAARKQVAAVCEKHEHLLVYSCVHEGLEASPAVIYVGGAPNQQLQPAARWAYANLHKRRFFLVGSDDVYSHAAHEILKDELARLGAEVVGNEYVPLEGTEFRPVVNLVKRSRADVVFNSVNGGSNLAFFTAMRAGGVRPQEVPTVWVNVGEHEMGAMRLSEAVGDHSAMPYFSSIDTPINRQFVKRFRARYPSRLRISDVTEASYCAVHLWKQAAEQAGTTEPPRVREAFRGQAFEGPEGRIRIDDQNLHAWRMARIARLTELLTFDIESSTGPLRPQPFPPTRPREEWERLLKSLHDGWGGRWEAPRTVNRD